MNENTEIEELYLQIENITMGTEPLISAGVLMAQALRIYKTVLSPEEYIRITQHILSTTDLISEYTIDKPTTH
jgi:hypothetical protein|tara:strand:+ start:2280 stop:2498 length:219 start_codon:yes stop_codon:yes gene_type:complete